MGKIAEFFKNQHIQFACVSGACIIILAVFFKRIMHEPVPNLAGAAPGLIFAVAEAIILKAKKGILSKVWFWSAVVLLTTAVIILKRLFW